VASSKMSGDQAEWKVTTDDTSKATNVGNFLKVGK
jgi:hypothetical protein